MTQEEKQLLLIDLCARLPYGIIVHIHNIADSDDYDRQLIAEDLDLIELYRRNCKPYLRPMSSMTEEEVVEYLSVCNNDYKDALTTPIYSGADWLNEHHFDYRGLIEKGLALEAPEGMYKNE